LFKELQMVRDPGVRCLSSAQIAAKGLKGLEPEDLELLGILEKTITRFEAIPLPS